MTSTLADRYELEQEIGRGAMGVVYMARDKTLDRRVAVKKISPDVGLDDELKARFLREARSAAGLSHPNIVAVHDISFDGDPFIVMEYVEGHDLKELVESRAFVPYEQKLDILVQVCRGLACAHAAGITHRDIKPHNIRITPEGIAKVLDFGIARVRLSDRTGTSQRLGTPYYMSPEQIDGLKDIDGRSDIFSLGVVFWEFLTFQRPFQADTDSAVFGQIAAHVPSLDDALKGASEALRNVIDRALAKDRDRRFKDCDAFAAALMALKSCASSDSAAVEPALRKARQKLDGLRKRRGEIAPVPGFYDESLDRLDLPEGPADDYGNRMHALTCLERHCALEQQRRRQARQIQDHRALANERLEAKDFEGCLECLGRIVQIYPEDFEARELDQRCRQEERRQQEREVRVRAGLIVARQKFDRGDFRACLRKLDVVLETDPDCEEARQLREESDKSLREKVGVLVEQVLRFETRGDYEGALAALGKAADLEPGNADLQDHRRRIGEEQRKRQESLAELTRRAEECEAYGDFQGASQAVDELLRLDPDNAQGIERRSRLAALVEKSRRVELFVKRAQAFVASGDYKLGLKAADEGLSIEPGHALLAELRQHSILGLEQSGATETDVSSVSGLLEFAKRDLSQGRLEDARQNIDFALRLVPDHIQALKLRDELIAKTEEFQRRRPRIRGTAERESATDAPAPEVEEPVSKARPLRLSLPRFPLPPLRVLWGLGIGLGVVAVTLALYWAIDQPRAAPPVPAEGLVHLRVVPWAVLESVVPLSPDGQEGAPLPSLRRETPCSFNLQSGRYKLRLSHPDYGTDDRVVEVASGAPLDISETLPGFDFQAELETERLKISKK